MFGDTSFQYMLDDDDLASMRELSQQLEDSVDSKHADFLRGQVLEAAEQLHPTKPLSATPCLPSVPSGGGKKTHPNVTPGPSKATPAVQSPSFSDLSPSPAGLPMAPSIAQPPVSPKSLKPPGNDVSPATAADFAHAPSNSKSLTPPPVDKPSVDVPRPPPVLQRSQRTRKATAHFAITVMTPPADHYYALFSAFGAIPPMHNEPAILAAQKTSDPDTLAFDEAMVDGYREKCIEAAEIEIRSLESKNTWIEVPKSSSKSRILPGTWVFCRKQSPDGSIRKCKARYCVRGDLHDQVTDPFAPVTAFSTVRIFLITSTMFKWHTCSIDFSNASVQAKLDEDIWIHLPSRGFHGEMKDSCLKLQRSLYGIATTSRLWASHLFKALLSLGFKQSKNGPCLFLKPEIYVIVCIDDTGVAAKNKGLVDELIASLERMV
jgi:Predicted membrane protein